MLTEGSGGKLNRKCEYIHFYYTGQIVFFFLCTKVEREIYQISTPVFGGFPGFTT